MSPSLLIDQPSQNGTAQPLTAAPYGAGPPLKNGFEIPTTIEDVAQTNPELRNNPSLQVTADHRIKMVEAPIHAPGPGEVLLHIKTTGICGSDIHFWKSGAIGSLKVEGDCILGHEAAGVVLQCGEGVSSLKRGDRVAVEPGVPCGQCFLCSDGRYNLCEDVQFTGVYPYHGTLQRYKVHPAKWLHKIPDNVSFAEGALLEPLSVVLHGINQAGLSLGRGAVICGAGPIGLIALAAARASGAHPLVITDLEPRRLDFAKKFVPTCRTYLVNRNLGNEENAAAIRQLFGSDEYSAPPTVLECTGVESSICTAAFSVRRGGTVMVIGVGKPVIHNIPFMHISLAEINLKFINRYRDTWPAGISALEGGILDLGPLVSHVFPLDGALDAMQMCSDLSKGSIKVQIVDNVDVLSAIDR
ncbi:alcohol dehydrogenase [Rhizodiscina lignyota]|uniref:Alcohol dehydrogenase n=1 Tax=Rhizodiscina lignyota TaxID=1504668 RepID=A0A9P4I9A3_9PEZI|nr:alcohol dehydrogenase [Rhizodiscina lignyota]